MKKNVSTNDIVLSAALKSSGVELQQITKEGNRGIFHFVDVDDEFIDRYALGKILVEPVLFNNTVRQLTTAVRRLV